MTLTRTQYGPKPVSILQKILSLIHLNPCIIGLIFKTKTSLLDIEALHSGGPGPLSAPVIVPALTAPRFPDDPTDITTDSPDEVTSVEDGQSVSEGVGSEVTRPGGALLPGGPALTQQVIPLSLYEAERIGGGAQRSRETRRVHSGSTQTVE